MNFGKVVSFMCTVLVGFFVTLLIDKGLGIDFKTAGFFSELSHKVMYVVWGAVLFVMVQRLLLSLGQTSREGEEDFS